MTAHTEINNSISTGLGFASPSDFHHRFIDQKKILCHPGFTIDKSVVTGGGTALFIDAESLQLDTIDDDYITVLTVPTQQTISMETFKQCFEQEKSRCDSFWNNNLEKIQDFNNQIIDSQQVNFTIVKAKQLIIPIINKTKDDVRESAIDESILVCLKVYQNYRTYMVNYFTHHHYSYSATFIDFFQHSKLAIWDDYLNILFSETTAIPTIENIVKFKNGSTIDDPDADNDDLVYHFTKSYPHGLIGATCEKALMNRYFHYEDIIDRISSAFKLLHHENENENDDDEIYSQYIQTHLLSLQSFHQCFAIVSSRCLEIPHSLNQELKDLDIVHNSKDFTTDTTLVPILDFANHSNSKQYYNSKFDVNTDGNPILKIDVSALKYQMANHPGQKEFEIFISYDVSKAVSFLCQYGFTPTDLNNTDVWEVSLTSIDQSKDESLFAGELLHPMFPELCKWFKILPTFQLILKFNQNGEIAVDKINLLPRYNNNGDSSKSQSVEDLLTLFHPNINKLKYNESCFDKFYNKDEAKSAGYKSVKEYGKILNYHKRSYVEVTTQNGFYLPKNKKSKFYPSSLSELRDALNNGAAECENQSLKNFKEFIGDVYVPYRLLQLTNLKIEIADDFFMGNFDNAPSVLKDIIKLEEDCLVALKQALQNSDKNIFTISKQQYCDYWNDMRMIPLLTDNSEEFGDNEE
ncbi:cytochrome c lysine N-methyltransferase [Saccharomycopsis crataegensis]|uniref:Cytochrome c lysine N-methyltransferase n=1 Tax=Saccharomycopsis crataegensis TaxID=43959 RepID=A0AAV5QTU5_9ASCO|nr:cytochrome c lysine N-methyltransferase [Saccharomycopsis crataegensis]